MSRVLNFLVDDDRPMAVSRSGACVSTASGSVLEVGGGSHATCIVNDGGAILSTIASRLGPNLLVGSGRAYAHRSQIELADRVMGLIEDQLAKVYFTSGGTEAFETALRIAYHVQAVRGETERDIVLGHRFSYHGMSIAARNVADHPEHAIAPQGLNYGWPKLGEAYDADFDAVERVFDQSGKRIAAVVVEPVAGTTGGAVAGPPGYLERLGLLCRHHGALLIIDEVVTAFGRTGTGFCSSSLRPDLIIGGKCLAASYAPIGCVILSGALCEDLRGSGPIPLRLTFAGNPLTCLMAIVVQEYVARSNLFERVAGNGARVGAMLRASCEAHRTKVEVHGIGHLWGLHMRVLSGEGKSHLGRLKRRASDEGVEFMGGIKPMPDHDSVHMTLTPAFDLSASQLDDLIATATRFFLRDVT